MTERQRIELCPYPEMEDHAIESLEDVYGYRYADFIRQDDPELADVLERQLLLSAMTGIVVGIEAISKGYAEIRPGGDGFVWLKQAERPEVH